VKLKKFYSKVDPLDLNSVSSVLLSWAAASFQVFHIKNSRNWLLWSGYITFFHYKLIFLIVCLHFIFKILFLLILNTVTKETVMGCIAKAFTADVFSKIFLSN
jgi:hypothetical protein